MRNVSLGELLVLAEEALGRGPLTTQADTNLWLFIATLRAVIDGRITTHRQPPPPAIMLVPWVVALTPYLGDRLRDDEDFPEAGRVYLVATDREKGFSLHIYTPRGRHKTCRLLTCRNQTDTKLSVATIAHLQAYLLPRSDARVQLPPRQRAAAEAAVQRFFETLCPDYENTVRAVWLQEHAQLVAETICQLADIFVGGPFDQAAQRVAMTSVAEIAVKDV